MATKSVMKIVTVRSERAMNFRGFEALSLGRILLGSAKFHHAIMRCENCLTRRLLGAFENGEKRAVRRTELRGPVVDAGREEIGRLLGGA
jgi:hypothetical protein